jgi:hypothetical protein
MRTDSVESLFTGARAVWVSYDNFWVCCAGSAGLILLLYGVKATVLRYVRPPSAALAMFFAAVVASVPVTWALSPDWDNQHVLRIAIYVGSPVATLAVPCASFLVDLARRSAGHPGGWLWRVPLELFLAVPAWLYLWVFFEFLVLGWVWI